MTAALERLRVAFKYTKPVEPETFYRHKLAIAGGTAVMQIKQVLGYFAQCEIIASSEPEMVGQVYTLMSSDILLRDIDGSQAQRLKIGSKLFLDTETIKRGPLPRRVYVKAIEP